MTTTQEPKTTSGKPLIMEFARQIHLPPLSPATYNPQSQTCPEFEEMSPTSGGDRSTCNRSSSTREGLFDMPSSKDADWKKDD